MIEYSDVPQFLNLIKCHWWNHILINLSNTFKKKNAISKIEGTISVGLFLCVAVYLNVQWLVAKLSPSFSSARLSKLYFHYPQYGLLNNKYKKNGKNSLLLYSASPCLIVFKWSIIQSNNKCYIMEIRVNKTTHHLVQCC